MEGVMVQLCNERTAHRAVPGRSNRDGLPPATRKKTADWAIKCCLSVDAWHLFMWIIDRVPLSMKWTTQMAAVVLANKMHHTVPHMNRVTIARWKWRITSSRLCEEEIRVMEHFKWALPSFIMTDCVRGVANVFPSMQLYSAMLKASVAVVREHAAVPVVDVCCASVRACVDGDDPLRFWAKYEAGLRRHVMGV